MEETYKEWIDKIAERHPYSIEETDEEWIDKIVESSRRNKKMETSQSRYGIVSDLTKKQLEIMDEKQNIEGSIESKKVEIKQLKVKMLEDEADFKKEYAERKILFQSRINKIEQEIASMEKGKNTKSKLCDDKIARLDKSLQAVADISKSSVEESKK